MPKMILARTENVLPNIIHHNQTRFIEDRYIGETVWSIFDIMELTVEANFPDPMIFIDFQKAFDSFEWKYLLNCFQYLRREFHNVKAEFEVHSSPDLNSRCQGKGSRRPWEVSQSGHKRQTGRSQGSKKERVKGMYNQAMELALHRNSGCQWQGWYQNAAQDLSRHWTPDRQIKDWWVHPRQKLTIEQMDKSLLTTLDVKHDGRISEVFLPKLR